MKKILKSRRGDGYIDVVVSVLVVSMLLIVALNIFSLFTMSSFVMGEIAMNSSANIFEMNTEKYHIVLQSQLMDSLFLIT